MESHESKQERTIETLFCGSCCFHVVLVVVVVVVVALVALVALVVVVTAAAFLGVCGGV